MKILNKIIEFSILIYHNERQNLTQNWKTTKINKAVLHNILRKTIHESMKTYGYHTVFNKFETRSQEKGF